MSTRFANFSLPLLARELIELAARRRTYLVRVAFATCLLLCVWLMFQLSTRDAWSQPLGYLGSGAILLRCLGQLLNIGLLLILPPMACDVFTQEKERQTIGLLFLTRLRPWTIVLEKYLSRLVPALCLMLISLPLLGFSYALGGIEIADLMGTSIGLFTNAATLTAIAVACSSMCRTSTAALLWTCALITVTPLIVIPNNAATDAFDFIVLGRFLHRSYLFDPMSIANSIRNGGPASIASDSVGAIIWRIITASVPSCLATVFFLCVARATLYSCAFKSESRTFRWLSDKVTWIRKFNPISTYANVVTHVSYAQDVPEQLPILWREQKRRWLSPNAMRIALLLVTLIVAGIQMPRDRNSITPEVLVPVQLFLWIGTSLWLITLAAGSVSRERSHQTLDVLLTTPISGNQLFLQKMNAIQVSMRTGLVPLGTLFLEKCTRSPWKVIDSGANQVYWLGPITELTMYLIYPQLVVWMAFYFSLKSATTVRAIVKSILSIAFLCIIPWIILASIVVASGGLSREYFGPVVALLLLGPENLLLYVYGFGTIPPGFHDSLFPVCLNSAIHGGLWLAIRRYCLRNADRLLGRCGT